MHAHGNMCNNACGIVIIGCNAARNRLASMSGRSHGDTCNKAGGAGIIGYEARDGIAPLRACLGHRTRPTRTHVPLAIAP